MKEPKCKFCGGKHYQAFCTRKPRKRIAVKKPLQTATKFKQPKIKAKSTSYRSVQIEKADRIFSKYIRLRYAINGFARCVTCGQQNHYKLMQNGHYIKRRIMATRYDEQNCNVQCVYCNETLGGNQEKYKKYLQRTYGVGVITHLQQKAQSNAKIQTYELQEIIDKYTLKVDEILKNNLQAK